jgi:hypothetical protein
MKLENEIRRYWGQKGYWKQRIVMNLAHQIGSLKEAWTQLNDTITAIRASWKQEEPEIDWVSLIQNNLTNVITIGD